MSLAVHLMDQAEWGLLPPDEALSAARGLLATMGVCAAPLGAAHDAAEAVALIAGAVSDALVRLAAADGGDFREGAPCGQRGQRRGMIDYERPVPVVDGKGGA